MQTNPRMEHGAGRARTRAGLGAMALGVTLALGACGGANPDPAAIGGVTAVSSAPSSEQRAERPGPGLEGTTPARLPQDPDKSPKDDTPNDTGPK